MCRARTRTVCVHRLIFEAISPPLEGSSSFTKHLGTPCLLFLAGFGFPSTITRDLFSGKRFPLYSEVLSRNLGGFSLASHTGTPLPLRMDRANEDLKWCFIDYFVRSAAFFLSLQHDSCHCLGPAALLAAPGWHRRSLCSHQHLLKPLTARGKFWELFKLVLCSLGWEQSLGNSH